MAKSISHSLNVAIVNLCWVGSCVKLFVFCAQ